MGYIILHNKASNLLDTRYLSLTKVHLVRERELFIVPVVNVLAYTGSVKSTLPALYAADVANQVSTDRDSCRKNAYGHPTLSPGVFTIFCMHGVCYGFENLQNTHSQSSRPVFRQLQMIIYDNCCKLHAYCLN